MCACVINCWQECGKIGTLTYCWWEYKVVYSLENGLEVPQNVNHRVTTWPSNSTFRYILVRIEKKNIHRKDCAWLFLAALIRIAKKKSPLSNKWINSGLPIRWNITQLEKEGNYLIDPCYNVTEPWKRYTQWRKPDTKGYIIPFT